MKDAILNFILVEITPDGNGYMDVRNDIAISTDFNLLVDYAKKTFNVDIGRPKNPSWERYYDIVKTEIKIIDNVKLSTDMLHELELKLDSTLANETKESLTDFINTQRKKYRYGTQ